MGISLKLAEFVANTKFEDIPEKVIATQKKSLLDGIAITFGAATLGDGCQQMVSLAEELACGGEGQATVIGFDEKLPAAWAAFANASMAHSLDYGDTHDCSIHSNSATMPAALAAAEWLGGVSGKKFLTALVVGSEVANRLASAPHNLSAAKGFYIPTIYTAYGACAAVASLMDLTAEQVLNAFSFTLCQATCSAELTFSPKTCVRSIREAFTAKAALVSCQMAKEGLIGFPEPFEGKLGFYFAFQNGEYDPDVILNGLGKEFICDRLQFKVWPSCAGTHASINGVLDLVKEYDIKPEEITKVIYHGGGDMLFYPKEIRNAPESSIIAKFSTPYTSAHAIVHGNVTLDSFTYEMLHEQKVRDLAAKFELDDTAQRISEHGAIVEIQTTRGTFKKEIVHVYGTPENPMSEESFAAKIVSCLSKARRPRTEADAKALADVVYSIDTAEDLSALIKLL